VIYDVWLQGPVGGWMYLGRFEETAPITLMRLAIGMSQGFLFFRRLPETPSA
jgi:hypothetical protein